MYKKILIINDWDQELVIWQTKNIAKSIGFSELEVALIATAASELTTNIIRFASRGHIIIESHLYENLIDNHIGELQIIASDKGPGIVDIPKAMTEQYSTYSGSLGMGLPIVDRIMDELVIDSGLGKGTIITTKKYLSYTRDRI